MKIIVLIFVLFLVFQTSFAQKEESKLNAFPEISVLTYTISDNSFIDELGQVCKSQNMDRVVMDTLVGSQICKSESINIARNSGGKNSEGRFPTAYSEGLIKPISIKTVRLKDPNYKGKHGESLFPGEYSKNLNKNRTKVLVDDIARNSNGQNSN